MSKKKLIFSLVVTSFSIISCGTVNFANASSVVEVCRLDAKIINVTEEHVFVDITGIKIYNKSSVLCADINKNSGYKIIKDNFLKNSYRESIFVGQNIIIDGVSGNAMGPDGPVYWDSWELESASGKAIKLPITLERVNINVTVGNTDSLIEGNTYTIAELNANTSRTVRNFFTEAYVLEYAPGILGACSKETGRCDVSVNAFVEIINECKSKNVANICSGEPDMSLTLPFGNVDLEKGKKYRFRITVWNKGNTETPTNQFTVVSVTNIDGSVVVSETPPITDQQAKRSLLGRIWNWFAGLFKR